MAAGDRHGAEQVDSLWMHIITQITLQMITYVEHGVIQHPEMVLLQILSLQVEQEMDICTFRKSAFNTQACEQLNAWLGGFESILRKMVPGNFDWFLHTMLTYHTTHVQKRLARANVHISDSSESSEI